MFGAGGLAQTSIGARTEFGHRTPGVQASSAAADETLDRYAVMHKYIGRPGAEFRPKTVEWF